MKVLAFDTATKTGVAFGEAGQKPVSFSINLGSVDWPLRFARLLKATNALIAKYEPDLVTVEAFVGGPKANSNLVGLVACVQGEAARVGVNVASYYPASIRKHFLGGIRSKAPIKSQVFARCRMLGWNVQDTDAADALALWDYTCAQHSRAHQMTTIGGMFGGMK